MKVAEEGGGAKEVAVYFKSGKVRRKKNKYSRLIKLNSLILVRIKQNKAKQKNEPLKFQIELELVSRTYQNVLDLGLYCLI
jgi:hypothetical protein